MVFLWCHTWAWLEHKGVNKITNNTKQKFTRTLLSSPLDNTCIILVFFNDELEQLLILCCRPVIPCTLDLFAIYWRDELQNSYLVTESLFVGFCWAVLVYNKKKWKISDFFFLRKKKKKSVSQCDLWINFFKRAFCSDSFVTIFVRMNCYSYYDMNSSFSLFPVWQYALRGCSSSNIHLAH